MYINTTFKERPMTRKWTWVGLGFLTLVIVALGLGLAINYHLNLPERINAMETIVLGQSRYVPGSQAALRIVVRNINDQSPLPDSTVKVLLQPAKGGRAIPLYEGTTDSSGVANVAFQVPDGVDPSQELIVETTSNLGEDQLERAVTIDREYKILLSTDKPLYQPGQEIHIRALSLSTFDLVPAAGREIEFIIADGKGNKVFRETVETSDFGIAAVDFQLASEVNTGPYKITTQMGNTSSEATVTVERYVLPKFDLNWNTDRAFYMPGERVSGTLTAEYFFGKDVSGGSVQIEGFTFDFERQDVFSLQGETDEGGNFEFTFALPDYIVASDLDQGVGRFYLEASVTDQAQHTERSGFSLPVSQNQIVIEAIPESGVIRPNVENILYILTSYPDGSPASTTLRLNLAGQENLQVQTGSYGLAEVRFTPQSSWMELYAQAQDRQGASSEAYFYFEGAWEEETVLLRPDQAVYRVGDTMHLDLLTSTPSGRVYLDIVREGQTMSTRVVEVVQGHGEIAIDLSQDLFGTLELHAYKILSRGSIVRDTRLVVVDAPSDLIIGVSQDKIEYLPGDLASLGFSVSGENGVGAQAALGLAIVDESLFALAEQDPGFAKLYFMLEAELLQPKYDVHGFSVPDLLGVVPDEPDLRTALEGAARASMASASTTSVPFSLQLNSYDEKIQSAYERQESFFSGITTAFFGLIFLVPVSIAGLTISRLKKQGTLLTSTALLIGVVVGLGLVIAFIPVPDWVGGRILDRITYMLDMMYLGDAAALVILLGGLISFIALVVHAIRNRDISLGLTLLLTVAFLPMLVGLGFVGSMSDINPPEGVLVLGVIAILAIPVAYLMRSAGFVMRRQFGWAVPAIAVGMIMLILPAFSVLSMSMGPGHFVNAMPAARGLQLGGFDGADMMVFEEAEMGLEAPADDSKAQTTAGEPPRLRQYFPETMYWNPEVITDTSGHISLEIPMADSITTWRLTALASTQDGRIGATTAGIRVFQDFFIDLDLPIALTQGDEVSVPVGVFNYLPEAQTVRLVIEEAGWFELLDSTEKEMDIAANDIDVVYFRIKAVEFGRKALQVTAHGTQLSDAIQREVTIYPNGKEIPFSFSDRLSPEGLSQVVNIPEAAIPGTQKLLVKIYPGVVSQVVEGLDSILRMPFGCFEQTSSTTYPNVLVLDYLETSGQASPEVQFKAEEYINLGYQRLTTFEVAGGGFSLFGDPPADRMLTAYGLQEFTDMSRVHNVDQDIVERAAEWLLSQQSSDGSWENDQGLVHESSWSNLQNDRLPVTAYVVWSLIEAGYLDDARTQSGLDYIRENFVGSDDPYVIALVANALVAADRESGESKSFTNQVLDALAEMAKSDGDATYWESEVATFMGSQGQTGSIETTALAAYAFLRGDSHPDLANGAITYLIRQKDSFGTWHSTQATVLALKVLIETVRTGAEDMDASVVIELNGGQRRTVNITPENFDVVQLIRFDDVNPGRANEVSISVEGEGELMYQISGSYYLPWDEVIAIRDGFEPELVTIDVEYDRTELKVDDTVQVDVNVRLNKEGRAEWVLIDLGIPPGFSVKSEDLNALVARYDDVPEGYEFPTIERFELTGRQILVYIGGLSHDHELSFSFRMQAKFPLIAQTPASSAYDYYNPDVNGEQVPVEIIVVADDGS
jgi:uncharacterized protein YfaS (alpha-2-macroglobulin family)